MFKYLSESFLRQSASEQSFQRGEKYYHQGRVVQLQYHEEIAHAIVIGTDQYQVSLNSVNYAAHCNCFAYEGSRLWCKHLVALGLTLLHGQIIAKKQPKIKKSGAHSSASSISEKHDIQNQPEWRNELSSDLADIIAALGHDEKEKLLFHVLSIFPDAYKAVEQIYLKKNNLNEFNKAFKKVISALKRSFHYESYVKNLNILSDLIIEQSRSLAFDEQGIQLRLECAAKILEEIDFLEWGYDRIESHVRILLDQAIEYFSRFPAKIILLENFMQHPSPLAEQMIDLMLRSEHQVCIQQLVNWIEQSNTRKLKFYNKNDDFQILVMAEWAAQGHPKFLKLIDECDLIKNKSVLYEKYYAKSQDWKQYLKYAQPKQDRIDQTYIQALTKTQQYAQLDAYLAVLLQKMGEFLSTSMLTVVKLRLNNLNLLSLSADEKLSRRQKIFEKVLRHAQGNELLLCEFFLDIEEFSLSRSCLVAYKQHLCNPDRTRYVSDETLRVKFNQLLSRWFSLEHDEVDRLCEELLNIEQDFLQNSKSSQYTFILLLLSVMQDRGLINQVEQFKSFAQSNLQNKKTLLIKLEKI